MTPVSGTRRKTGPFFPVVLEFRMKKVNIKLVKQSFSVDCLMIATIIIINPFYVMAQDNNQEIYNQLYLEIINISGTGNADKLDSMGSSRVGVSERNPGLPSGNTSDVINERLKSEMEKIIKDAQIRHSDAIKFMQDTK